MAARLDPNNVRRAHQSLHHVVAVAPWNDQVLLQAVREYVPPQMASRAPISAWVVDDTGFPKKGNHSIGVARQSCGQVGRQANCQLAVSLSLSTVSASLPIAYELYLPETWSEDPERRRKAGVPEDVVFRTKPLIAAEQIQRALADGVPRAPIVADVAYGYDTKFRQALLDMGLEYVVGIQPALSVWPPGNQPLPPKPRKSTGRPPKLRQRSPNHQPVLAKDLAASLGSKDWQTVTWRDGTTKKLPSRFAAVRVRPANRDYERSEPLPEQWLLIEWPEEEVQPTKYWELKQELGLGHYEGRGWGGFHHHATLCIAAYGFLIAERSRFSPSARAGQRQLALPEVPPDWKPHGAGEAS